MAFYFDSFWMDIFLSIVVIIAASIFYVKQQYQFWQSQGIPQMPVTFPFGSTKNVLRTKSIGVFMAECHKYFRERKQAVGGYYFGLRPELLIMDPDIIRNILIKDFASFMDRSLYWNPETDPLTNSLVTMRGQHWHQMRKKMSPLFTTSKVKMVFPVLVEMSRRLYKVLLSDSANCEPINIVPIMCNYTVDEIGSFLYGLECNSLTNKDSKFRKCIDMIFEPKGHYCIRYFLAYAFPNLLRRLRIPVLMPEASNFFLEIVKETLKQRDEENVNRSDYLDILRQMRNKEGKDKKGDKVDGLELTDKVIAGQCFAFFAAGYETSSETESFCFFELAQNQNIQDKLREEILEVISNHNGEITYDAIMEMQYLDKVVHETLRKYPPFPFITRNCTKDYWIRNTKILIRKGQVVTIPLLGIQRDPEYYPDPEKFDPERFSEEAKSKRVPFTFFPFGEGPRYCIGAKLGLTKVKLAVTSVIKDYKITLNERTKLPLEFSAKHVSLTPKGAIWLNVTEINK